MGVPRLCKDARNVAAVSAVGADLLALQALELGFTGFDARPNGHTALLEPIGFVAGFQDAAMVGETVQ